LGHLYDFEVIEPDELQKLSVLRASLNHQENKTLAWLRVYSSYRWQSFVPLLVPVSGMMDKAGDSIKSFRKGFENINTNTPDEQELYELSKTMFAKTRDEKNWEFCDLLNGENYISENYNHWKQVLPMLAGQPFVYKYRLAKSRYFMKQAPGKRYLQKISISVEQPQIQFILKDKGNYYQLSIQFLIRGLPIKIPVADRLFFICDGQRYYLLASLRDVAVAQWMTRFDNLISVLKPNFALFEKEILQAIEAIYPVVGR
jgi:hypothetical protein